MPSGISVAVNPAQPLERKVRVLVVDDNRDAVSILAALLQHEGYEVRVALDGENALATARDFRPDALLLDIALPGGISGWEVARQIRRSSARAARPLIIAVSAKYRESPDKRLDCDHFVAKPYDPNFLLALLLPLASSRAYKR